MQRRRRGENSWWFLWEECPVFSQHCSLTTTKRAVPGIFFSRCFFSHPSFPKAISAKKKVTKLLFSFFSHPEQASFNVVIYLPPRKKNPAAAKEEEENHSPRFPERCFLWCVSEKNWCGERTYLFCGCGGIKGLGGEKPFPKRRKISRKIQLSMDSREKEKTFPPSPAIPYVLQSLSV